jgi:hypothetical protein
VKPATRSGIDGGKLAELEFTPLMLIIGGSILAIGVLAVGLWLAFGRGSAPASNMPATFAPPIPGPPGRGAAGRMPQPGPPGGFPQPGPPGGFPR